MLSIFDAASDRFVLESERNGLQAAQPAGHDDDELFWDAAEDFDADDTAFQTLQLEDLSTDLEWLRGVLRKPDMHTTVRLLEKDAEGRARLIMPSCDVARRAIGIEAVRQHDSQQAARVDPFCFVTIREVLFRDGTVFCNTCTNPACNRHAAGRQVLQRICHTHEWEHEHALDALQGHSALCLCAQAAVQHLWGSIGSSGVLEDGEEDESSFAAWFIETDHERALHC